MPATAGDQLLTTVTAITKDIYQGKIQTQMQDEVIGLKRIEQTSNGVESNVGGKHVTFPLRVARNQGLGYRNEYHKLQEPGKQQYASVRIPLKYGYGRVRLSGQLIALADKNYQAFASAMDEEMDGLKRDLAKDSSRIFYGTGDGVLLTVQAATASTTLTAEAGRSVKYLEVGMLVDIAATSVFTGGGTSLTGTVYASDGEVTTQGGRTVTSINKTNNTFTISGAGITTTAGNAVIRPGNYNREPNGLGNIVAAGELHQLNSSAQALWQGVINTNATNRALSEGQMITNVDEVRTNGGKTSVILTSLGVRRAYFNLLTQQRRYPQTTEFAGGYKGLAFNSGHEIPVVEDVDCPDNTMFGLDESVFKVYRESDWEFLQRDGSIWKWVRDYDAYEAVIAKYWELGVNRRNANWKMDKLTEG